jgi:hypothetical protein
MIPSHPVKVSKPQFQLPCSIEVIMQTAKDAELPKEIKCCAQFSCLENDAIC